MNSPTPSPEVLRALSSPMAYHMMRSLREYWEEHSDAWKLMAALLGGEALRTALRYHLTVPVRIDRFPRRRQTA